MIVERRVGYIARCYEGMAEQPHLDRVWDIIELVGVCMLTTRFTGGLRARPLESRPDLDAGVSWFVTDPHSAKEWEIESDTMSGSHSSMQRPTPTSLSRRVPRCGAILPRRPKSGSPPTACGGKDPTTRTWG